MRANVDSEAVTVAPLVTDAFVVPIVAQSFIQNDTTILPCKRLTRHDFNFAQKRFDRRLGCRERRESALAHVSLNLGALGVAWQHPIWPGIHVVTRQHICTLVLQN